jgi:hypothetical protein
MGVTCRDKEREGEVGLGKGERKTARGRCGLCDTAEHMWSLLTIDVETVLVQGVGAQLGDTMGQLAQLSVQLLSVQSRACGIGAVGTDSIHSCGCSILLRPGVGR